MHTSPLSLTCQNSAEASTNSKELSDQSSVRTILFFKFPKFVFDITFSSGKVFKKNKGYMSGNAKNTFRDSKYKQFKETSFSVI